MNYIIEISNLIINQNCGKFFFKIYKLNFDIPKNVINIIYLLDRMQKSFIANDSHCLCLNFYVLLSIIYAISQRNSDLHIVCRRVSIYDLYSSFAPS